MNRMSDWKFLWAMVVLSAVALPGSETAAAASNRAMIAQVDLGRQEIDLRGTVLVQAGNDLLLKKDFFAARDKYMEAVKLFRRFGSPYFREKIEYCQKKIAECYFGKASEAMRQADAVAHAKDFEEAIKLCREAIKYCPEQVDELNRKIEFYEKRRDLALLKSATSESRLLPNKEAQAYQIQVLLEQGRKLVGENELVAASRKFQEVLMIDPFNAEAIRSIQGTNARISKIGLQRYVNTHRRMAAEVEWKYSLPVAPQVAEGVGQNVIADNLDGKPKNSDVALSPLRQKLEEIIIPETRFLNMPVGAIIKNLQDQSRVHDLKHKRGVNIIYMPNARGIYDAGGDEKAPAQQQQQQQKKKKAQGEGEEGEDFAADEESEENLGPKVSLEGDKRSLLKVIQALCDIAKLESQIEDYAVVLTPKDVTLSEMEVRIFPISIPDDADEATISGTIKNGIQQYCKNLGYSNVFPKGSKVFYDSRIKRVIVSNTVDNLGLIENAINKIYTSNTVPMVQIMIKLVDINQNDLDELAFNWQLAVNAKESRVNTDGSLNSAGIMDTSNSLLRYYNPADQGPAQGDINSSTLSYVWMNDKGTQLIASMFALDQSGSSDLLQAPRVTVKDNQLAQVKMVEKHKYPDGEWEEVDTVSTDNFRATAAPQPNLDREEELGISFEIIPKVDNMPNPEDIGKVRRRIRAPVKVRFQTLAGWTEYDTRTYDADGEVSSGGYYKFPILNTPRIETQVYVLDGETIVVGGVIADETYTLNDKIPLLGDLPLVGRFFQSKATRSTKRNLLVFATFRIVTPSGAPEHADSRTRGLPDLGL